VLIPYGSGMIESLNFYPAKVTVVIGVNNTVIWNDLDSMQHSVTSTSVPLGAQPFDSGTLNQGQTFTVTFTVPGMYKYDCTQHPNWMIGSVLVVAST
jgi:plastocyanin